MWHRKQADAFAAIRPGEIVVARDVSSSGHKEYGCLARSAVDSLPCGCVNEVIRTGSVCWLYFDLEHPRADGDPDDDAICEELIAGVRSLLVDLYTANFESTDVLLADSSTPKKFSRHVIFPVQFRNNWRHMRNFVRALMDRGVLANTWTCTTRAGPIEKRCIDDGVYTKNRCFRMVSQSKWADPTRTMNPLTGGNPSDYLVEVVDPSGVLEFEDVTLKAGCAPRGKERGPVLTGDSYALVPKLNVPADWNHKLTALDPPSFLAGIPPVQPHALWWRIGAAYKGCGGSFEDWYRLFGGKTATLKRCSAQWKGWKVVLGFPFLRACALHCCDCPEEEILMEEAFGFHPEPLRTVYVNQRYLNPDRFPCARALLVKSNTGTGKSTAAKNLVHPFRAGRILWLVSNRALAYNAVETLNEMNYYAFDGQFQFVNYLSTNRPLHKIRHLVCTVQSLWRTALHREAYDVVVIDEISSVLEDITGKTSKHIEANMDQLEWVAKSSKLFLAMDAHVYDTSKVLFRGYFDDSEICVVVNKHRGPRRQARILPKPEWTLLKRLRGSKLRDATSLYERLLDCWVARTPAFFVCNNRKLGDFVETTFLKNSLIHAQLACHTKLPLDLISTVLSFLPESPGVHRYLKHAWIHRDDGRPPAYFKPANLLHEWSSLDLLMYTLKITQGVDYSPKEPHFGCGFVYTTPNTCVPRRVMQQIARVRKLGKNPFADCPVIFFSFGTKICRGHLPQCGLSRITAFADKQEYFLDLVSKHWGAKLGSVMCEPTPMWREIYLRLANERETFLHFPLAAYHWWIRHDGFEIHYDRRRTVQVDWTKVRVLSDTVKPYHEIRDINEFEYEAHAGPKTLEIVKYEFRNLIFDFSSGGNEGEIWDYFLKHRDQTRNVQYERFVSIEEVLDREHGKLTMDPNPGEWAKMLACKMHVIRGLADALKLPGSHFWNNDNRDILAEQWGCALSYVQAQEVQLAATWKLRRPSTRDWRTSLLKTVLRKWGGYLIKTVQRRVDRVRPPCPLKSRYTLSQFQDVLTTSPATAKLFYAAFPSNRMLSKNVASFVSSFRKSWRQDHPPINVDKSIRRLSTGPWRFLNYNKR